MDFRERYAHPRATFSTIILAALAAFVPWGGAVSAEDTVSHKVKLFGVYVQSGDDATEDATDEEPLAGREEPGDATVWDQFASDNNVTSSNPWSDGIYWQNDGLTCIPMGGGCADTYDAYFPFEVVEWVDISRNDLTDVEGLASIRVINGPLRLRLNNLDTLAGLRGLEEAENIGADGNNLTTLDGLHNLKEAQGINFAYNAIVDITGLQSLVEANKLDLSNNNLETLDGLQSLTTLSGELDVGRNALTDITALANLQEVTTLTLSDNQLLTLEGLEGLTSISGRIRLRGNDDLADLSALSNVTSYTGDRIEIDVGIEERNGFMPISAASDLCAPANEGTFVYAQQADVCAD
ncbi:leucine-rich repeat domain-containing protein [Thioalkalivibrio sp. ALE16]|uniref:leucine-rich repeat domain-containing protein n=1 Tax=Thioalkalivibrio sp. ALE16 TaxID=1158172 RepID=UPI00037EC421|nr:leucine-rich repeat domain-containing protein [Thioalkalivibrio sp. ALE16]